MDANSPDQRINRNMRCIEMGILWVQGEAGARLIET